MTDSPNSGGGLLDEFRRRIGDTSYNYVQLEVSCDDAGATQALLEITDTNLITTITGGTATPLDLDLFDPDMETVEKLAAKIRSNALYAATVAMDGEGSHSSSDLEIIPPKSCLRRKVQLRSRRWSDAELTDILSTALTKLGRDLGTVYSLTTVPSAVKDLLFILGTVGMYWDQVNNATKRRGVDLRVEDFSTLHQRLLDEYDRSLKAYKELQPTPVQTLTAEQLDDLGAGEVIVGTLIRRNLRTGRLTPSSAVGYPAAEVAVATFIGSGKIMVNWTRSHASGFYRYELWRGTVPEVSNISEVTLPLGSVTATGTKIAMLPEAERTSWVDGGTSPLPPGTYYYRLYVYNANGLWAASEPVSATVV